MKKKISLITILVSLFLMSSCTPKDKVISTNDSSTTTVEFTEQEQKILDEGYPLSDGYTLFLMNMQKQNEQETKENLDEFELSIASAFEKYKSEIDRQEKVNIIPFKFSYDIENEILLFNCFFVNNQLEDINEISFRGRPEITPIEAGPLTEISFDKSNFTKLPQDGVVVIGITAEAPIELEPYIRKATMEDVSFVFKDLKLNGEAVENVNEN